MLVARTLARTRLFGSLGAQALATRRYYAEMERYSANAGPENSPARMERFKVLYEDLSCGADEISRDALSQAIQQALPMATVADEQSMPTPQTSRQRNLPFIHTSLELFAVEDMFRIGDMCGSGTIDFERFVKLFDVFEEAELDDDAISIKQLAERWIGLSSGQMSQNPDVLFQLAWRRIADNCGGEEHVRLPREIMFLGGAPGAGKGTMTPHIMRERGLLNQPVSMYAVLAILLRTLRSTLRPFRASPCDRLTASSPVVSAPLLSALPAHVPLRSHLRSQLRSHLRSHLRDLTCAISRAGRHCSTPPPPRKSSMRAA